MNKKASSIEENRQYAEMLNAAIDKLRKYTPQEIVEKSNVDFDEEKSEFRFKSLGQEMHLSYPEFDLTPSFDMWYHLTVLQYIDTADGTPLGDSLISLSDFKDGGVVRGTSFDRECDRLISKYIGDKDVDLVKKACGDMGAEIIKSKADLSVKFSFMPNYPLVVNIWFADDELEGSGKVLVNSSAEHYLTVEASGSVATIVLNQLIKRLV